ncbi:MAG: chemotaxis protein CheB [Acidobacteriaceae bacterium]
MNKMYVVGIGGAEGSLSAYAELFSAISAEIGFAFVILNHPLTGWKALLPETLAAHSQMAILPMTEGDYLRPNTIYVNPPDATVTLVEGEFIFQPRSKATGGQASISLFFHSLAHDQEERAIAVILSGQGTDGADALEYVKQAGGVTFAQTAASAKHPSMPERALASGFVDYCLDPSAIGSKLQQLAESAGVSSP